MKTLKNSVQASILAILVSANSAPAFAGAQVGGNDRPADCAGVSEVLLGLDNDNVNNAIIQPFTPPANQSQNNADILLGNDGCDVLIGLFGNDVLDGGIGSDIMIGGTEQFDPEGFGNKDVMIGGEGNDTNIWAPGDGSDAFLGGRGTRDAQVFGLIDRDSNNVPILIDGSRKFSETGIPTANVTESPGFCRLEDVRETELGFDYLVRFFVRARPENPAVTVRLKDVEQVFCTSEIGGEITYADLTDDVPSLDPVPLSDIRRLNRTVSEIIR